MQASWKQDTVNLEQIWPNQLFQAAATTGTYLEKLMQPHSVHSLVANTRYVNNEISK